MEKENSNDELMGLINNLEALSQREFDSAFITPPRSKINFSS